MGGPTGLFTIYDGQTLRRGEFTFSIAYSNFDRDPGNADFVEVPVSFQVGLSNHLELFFNTDAYRAIKVNTPDNLSGFYLPNSRLRRTTTGIGTANPTGSALVSPAAIILAPRGPGTSQFGNAAIFRPQGQQPFLQYPYVGGGVGNFGLFFPSGPIFGFPAGTFPTIGPPVQGGNGADLFPGLGSPVGGILPGLVLQTVCTAATPTVANCNALNQAPTVFTLAPSYLPDAPFINRTYGESAFNTFTAGAKWRFTGPSNPVGVGLIAYYRWYADKADDFSGWNQLQRGASPGGNRGDIGVVLFGDARVRTWMNVSANLGYNYNSSVKGEFPNGEFTLLDRPDEVLAGVAVDFPVNRYFQPILEFRSTQYVGGRTPNAFENSPIEGLAGFRWFPARWVGLGLAYRRHFNSQDQDFIEDNDAKNISVVGNVPGGTVNSPVFTSTGAIRGFTASTDPHGFIVQGFIGRRNKRGVTPPINLPPNVTQLVFDRTSVSLPCPPGTNPPAGGECAEPTVRVTTTAVDPENDVLTYNYTVSGGRIVGQGANVTWDLSGVRPGTYTITAGADDGCGVCGKTETRTIEVRDCPNCETPRPPCECPTFTISGPSGVTNPGDTMTFTANVSGGTAENITYNWTVSAGTIESGQGTPSITVRVPADLFDSNITATVDIQGTGLCETCERQRSETAPTSGRIRVTPFDTFGALQNDEVRGRLDNFFVALRNDPTASGFILIDGPEREAARREALIRNHMRLRRFPADRIRIERGDTNATEIFTRLYVIPAGRTEADIDR
ncbi:MAG TPA: hypothetical protein VK400_07265 [Pyrinomonadaceae bacterium]|nr:hypothetical protein [Pyrinomonadaceae bacterium]